MSHSYPSDISREQFARILPTLESARRRTKPRTVDLYDVFCGVLYLLKSGCQWRMLPADFPDWRTCYKYFRLERAAWLSILEQVLKKIGWRVSVDLRQSPARSCGLTDHRRNEKSAVRVEGERSRRPAWNPTSRRAKPTASTLAS